MIKDNDEVFYLTTSLGFYNRNPCESNTLPTIVVDDLSPRQMKASKYMVRKFIHVIEWPIENMKFIASKINLNKAKYKRRHDVRH